MESSVICFGEDWGRHPGSAQDIMERLSATRTILWIDSLGLRRPRLSMDDAKRILTKARNWLRGARQPREGIVVYTPIVLPVFGSTLARRINSVILTATVKRLIRKHHLVNPILWVSCPAAEGVVGKLGESKSIYYCADEHSVFPGLSPETVRLLEESIFKKVNQVIVTSTRLLEAKAPYNTNLHYVPHGVDFDHFSKAAAPETAVPEDIARIKKPIIGFYGLIQDLIDFSLVEYLAKSRPDWSIVMVGPVLFDVGPLPSLPNLHFVGKRTREELPNYVKAFDVCMIPYKLTERTIYANPLKLRQYLASGKPVVSTPLPEVLRYEDLVKVGRTPEEYLQAVEWHLAHRSEEESLRRMDAVRDEGWDHVMDRIRSLL